MKLAKTRVFTPDISWGGEFFHRVFSLAQILPNWFLEKRHLMYNTMSTGLLTYWRAITLVLHYVDNDDDDDDLT